MKRSAFAFRRALAVGGLAALAAWVINAEVRGLPSRHSLFVSVPVSTTFVEDHKATVITNKLVEIGPVSGITEEDFSEIKARLRPFVYRGKFFDSIEVVKSNAVLVWNTNKGFSVEVNRQENVWHASWLNQGILD